MRKKFRLRAAVTAVSRAAARPPHSATTMMRAMKTNVKFEAVVKPRNGTRAMPIRIAANGPTAA